MPAKASAPAMQVSRAPSPASRLLRERRCGPRGRAARKFHAACLTPDPAIGQARVPCSVMFRRCLHSLRRLQSDAGASSGNLALTYPGKARKTAPNTRESFAKTVGFSRGFFLYLSPEAANFSLHGLTPQALWIKASGPSAMASCKSYSPNVRTRRKEILHV